jgi:hypothetical protein
MTEAMPGNRCGFLITIAANKLLQLASFQPEIQKFAIIKLVRRCSINEVVIYLRH